MATYTVKGFITYPFEVEVDIDVEVGAEGSVDFGTEQLLESVDARDGSHFGQLAFGDSEIWVEESGAEISISAVVPGGIEWVDDGLPHAGIADGKGGVVWQET